jgi:D-aminoacyl-tRNA deacylase
MSWGRLVGGSWSSSESEKTTRSITLSSWSKKLSNLRIFPDLAGRMNLSLLDISGQLLVVSQFTLYADTRKGNRPSYDDAAPVSLAKPLYDHFVQHCRDVGLSLESGVFQAHMHVELINDGPVTLLCSSEN